MNTYLQGTLMQLRVFSFQIGEGIITKKRQEEQPPRTLDQVMQTLLLRQLLPLRPLHRPPIRLPLRQPEGNPREIILLLEIRLQRRQLFQLRQLPRRRHQGTVIMQQL